MMERAAVASKTVATIGYDRATATLEVNFVNRGCYLYFGVPEKAYQTLMLAPSKGQYINEFIKCAGYRYRRVR
jgi:hypothetical protein